MGRSPGQLSLAVLPCIGAVKVGSISKNKRILFYHHILIQRKAHRVVLISIFSARHQLTLQGDRASAKCSVSVYVPAFTGIHCIYPRRDGQAELIYATQCTKNKHAKHYIHCMNWTSCCLYVSLYATNNKYKIQVEKRKPALIISANTKHYTKQEKIKYVTENF